MIHNVKRESGGEVDLYGGGPIQKRETRNTNTRHKMKELLNKANELISLGVDPEAAVGMVSGREYTREFQRRGEIVGVLRGFPVSFSFETYKWVLGAI